LSDVYINSEKITELPYFQDIPESDKELSW